MGSALIPGRSSMVCKGPDKHQSAIPNTHHPAGLQPPSTSAPAGPLAQKTPSRQLRIAERAAVSPGWGQCLEESHSPLCKQETVLAVKNRPHVCSSEHSVLMDVHNMCDMSTCDSRGPVPVLVCFFALQGLGRGVSGLRSSPQSKVGILPGQTHVPPERHIMTHLQAPSSPRRYTVNLKGLSIHPTLTPKYPKPINAPAANATNCAYQLENFETLAGAHPRANPPTQTQTRTDTHTHTRTHTHTHPHARSHMQCAARILRCHVLQTCSTGRIHSCAGIRLSPRRCKKIQLGLHV